MIRINAGETITFEGQSSPQAYMLMSGWACTVRHLIDGSDQIFDVRLPGDFIGTSHLMFKGSTLATEAITAVELFPFTYEDILAWESRSPGTYEKFVFAMNCDEVVMIEHVIGIARRNPQVRTAHFLLELSERVARAGLGTIDRFSCPMSQYVLADTLGLTAVHLNRTLRSLRELGLVSFRHSKVVIHDRPEMIRFAGFDPAYLNQTPALRLARRRAEKSWEGDDRRGAATAPRQQ
ncbi:MAG: Crp/Fnr family transcriptional regulator [Paracoccus sp. (in: a-proteobacteria)]